MNRIEELIAAKEKAQAEGKEPFDFVKFASVYPHDTGNCERLKPDEPAFVQTEYERKFSALGTPINYCAAVFTENSGRVATRSPRNIRPAEDRAGD